MTSDIYIFRHFPATLFCNLWLHKQEAAKQSTTGCHTLTMAAPAWHFLSETEIFDADAPLLT